MFLGIPWTEWLGYLASLIVAISLLMKSLLRLRWINTAGSLVFAVYGFLIGAYPVGGFNAVIVCINIYFLIRIYRTQETFELMEVRADDLYLPRFLQFHHADITRFFPAFDATRFLQPDKEAGAVPDSRTTVGFYILRDMTTAGLFLGKLDTDGQLEIHLDYVVPAYRDYKSGRFLFSTCRNRLANLGVRRLIARAGSKTHGEYLLRMGFSLSGDTYSMPLQQNGRP